MLFFNVKKLFSKHWIFSSLFWETLSKILDLFGKKKLMRGCKQRYQSTQSLINIRIGKYNRTGIYF